MKLNIVVAAGLVTVALACQTYMGASPVAPSGSCCTRDSFCQSNRCDQTIGCLDSCDSQGNGGADSSCTNNGHCLSDNCLRGVCVTLGSKSSGGGGPLQDNEPLAKMVNRIIIAGSLTVGYLVIHLVIYCLQKKRGGWDKLCSNKQS